MPATSEAVRRVIADAGQMLQELRDKYGDQDRRHTPEEWLAILAEELMEAIGECPEFGPSDLYSHTVVSHLWRAGLNAQEQMEAWGWREVGDKAKPQQAKGSQRRTEVLHAAAVLLSWAAAIDDNTPTED